MKQTLSERIGAKTANISKTVEKQLGRNALNRAVFLSLRLDIKQALNDGWPVKHIWTTLNDEGKIGFTYEAFRGYVNRLILSPPAIDPALSSPASDLAPKPAPINPTNPADPKTAPKQPVASLGFTFNSNPNKEDLL